MLIEEMFTRILSFAAIVDVVIAQEETPAFVMETEASVFPAAFVMLNAKVPIESDLAYTEADWIMQA